MNELIMFTHQPKCGGTSLRCSIKNETCKYEKILFFEAYNKALEYMSEVLGVELKEYHENISTNYVERSAETDNLIDRYLVDAMKLYDFLFKRFGSEK
jgi:hypothetical protein